MPNFYSLDIARSGLFASQKALEVTGHNIANANTDGYSRQRLELSQIAYTGTESGARSNQVMVGAGVSIDGLSQIRDKYLDYQYRNENSLSNEFGAKAFSMEYIESVMKEPSDYGISAAMSDLFDSLDELSNNAGDESLREIVVQNAVKLTDAFKSISGQLLEYQSNLDKNISMRVDTVNGIADEIRNLNELIFDFEISGQRANDLRDQRNNLVDELSELVPVTAEESSNGEFRVNVGGMAIVNHLSVNKMETRQTLLNTNTGDYLEEIYWENTPSKVNISSGELKGLLDLRDGNSQHNQGIPFLMDRIDTLARGIVENFNIVNKGGYTLPYDTNLSRTGVNFFDPTGITAQTISLSDELLESGYNIAASSDQIIGDTYWGKNENAVKFNQLRDKTGITVGGTVVGNLEEYYQKTISQMAITAGYYTSSSSSQDELTNHIQNQRMSVSQVSIDEEMTNLVQYQHSYQAAAKLITTIDEMLQILLNMV